MLLWEVLIKKQGKYGEMCCSKSYRYANRRYKKLKNVEKYIVYTDVPRDTQIDKFRSRGKIDSSTIIYKEEMNYDS